MVFADEQRSRRAAPLQHAAAAGGDRRRQAESVAGRLRRRSPRAGARLHRRVRGHGRPRRRRARARVRAGARRLQRDSGQGAGRSAGRSLRRVSPRAVARGLGHRRERRRTDDILPSSTAASGPDSAIPPVRITARSSSCSICSSAARCRHRADRARGDDAGGQRQRAVLRASRRRATSPSAASARIRSSATRGAKGSSIDDTSSAGSPPQLAYESARC